MKSCLKEMVALIFQLRRWQLKHSFCYIFIIIFMQTLNFSASAQYAENRCVIVDTDVNFDDLRALTLLTQTEKAGRIAAIVVTEGISRRADGIRSIKSLLYANISNSTPLYSGPAPSHHRKYKFPQKFNIWRGNAETLNGKLKAQDDNESSETLDLGAKIFESVKDCEKVALLIIGPWTSFIRYAPEILDRVDRIVAQGRPYPDEVGGEPDGFNCVYDKNACLAAFDLLVGRQQRSDRKLRADWIDIPGSPLACGEAMAGIDAKGNRLYEFVPTTDWFKELEKRGGLGGELAELHLRDLAKQYQETSLWDDLAALYLIRPEIFVRRGGHLEPCISGGAVRDILTNLISAK